MQRWEVQEHPVIVRITPPQRIRLLPYSHFPAEIRSCRRKRDTRWGRVISRIPGGAITARLWLPPRCHMIRASCCRRAAGAHTVVESCGRGCLSLPKRWFGTPTSALAGWPGRLSSRAACAQKICAEAGVARDPTSGSAGFRAPSQSLSDCWRIAPAVALASDGFVVGVNDILVEVGVGNNC